MTQLTHQNDEAPLYLHSHGRSYNLGWCGPEGIIAGLKAIRAAWELQYISRTTFLIADHHTKGEQVYHVATIGITQINGELRWRWCGENDNPDGAGSSTICDYDPNDLSLIATMVTFNLTTHQTNHQDTLIFRKRFESDI